MCTVPWLSWGGSLHCEVKQESAEIYLEATTIRHWCVRYHSCAIIYILLPCCRAVACGIQRRSTSVVHPAGGRCSRCRRSQTRSECALAICLVWPSPSWAASSTALARWLMPVSHLPVKMPLTQTRNVFTPLDFMIAIRHAAMQSEPLVPLLARPTLLSLTHLASISLQSCPAPLPRWLVLS